MTERLHGVALTPEEINTVLVTCGTEALLVGGQALAFWAEYFKVAPTGELSAHVTTDIDFVGNSPIAKRLGKALKWKTWVPSMDDATNQTAKVTKLLPDGGVKQVDFLSGIVGLDTARIQRRAVEVTLASEEVIRVLHPIDVLESRLRNLETLPEKRDAVGVAQARLAVIVVAAFFESKRVESAPVRELLDAAESVAALALDKGLAKVTVDYRVDPLEAIPASRIRSSPFRTKRWPQILSGAQALRNKVLVPKQGTKPR